MRRKNKLKLVDIQRTRVVPGTEHSYSEYIERAAKMGNAADEGYFRRNDDGEEYSAAAPDTLAESKDTTPSNARLIMGEAIQHLQGRQREVYILSMREDKSLADIGEILDISKSSAQVYLDRAIKFISAYCHEAIKKGRV